MSDDDQRRLQEYGAVGAPPVEEAGPVCERCGDDVDDDDGWIQLGRAEQATGFVDVREYGAKRALCGDCADLERYLDVRYNSLIENVGVEGAVAVFCSCHGDDEVDVQPLRHGDSAVDAVCSKCGSGRVVVEELPPTSEHGTEVKQ